MEALLASPLVRFVGILRTNNNRGNDSLSLGRFKSQTFWIRSTMSRWTTDTIFEDTTLHSKMFYDFTCIKFKNHKRKTNGHLSFIILMLRKCLVPPCREVTATRKVGCCSHIPIPRTIMWHHYICLDHAWVSCASVNQHRLKPRKHSLHWCPDPLKGDEQDHLLLIHLARDWVCGPLQRMLLLCLPWIQTEKQRRRKALFKIFIYCFVISMYNKRKKVKKNKNKSVPLPPCTR
jgi:hypothetical protein